jgi:acetyl esterase
MSEHDIESETVDPLMALVADNPPQTPLELREMLDAFSLALNVNLPDIESIDDVLIESFEGQDLTVDIHRPQGDGPFPILVYLHGGGWILGTPKTHRKLAFRFAEAGFLVFNVHYRLAPEHPFPAAYDDCVTALKWVHENAAAYGGDVSRIAVGGDSAGGNLTAAIAAADDANLIKCILLLYPALDFGTMDDSLGALPGSDVNMMSLMVDSYIGHDFDALVADPRVSPIHHAQHLPPAHIMCGTMDTLIDDCRRLAGLLEDAGISHETAFYDLMPHGFAQLEDFFPEARQSIDAMVAYLNRTLG